MNPATIIHEVALIDNDKFYSAVTSHLHYNYPITSQLPLQAFVGDGKRKVDPVHVRRVGPRRVRIMGISDWWALRDELGDIWEEHEVSHRSRITLFLALLHSSISPVCVNNLSFTFSYFLPFDTLSFFSFVPD